MDKLIGSKPLSQNVEVRVGLEAFKGKQYLHARRFYTHRDHPDRFLPGKGLGVAVGLLPWLRAQLAEAERYALDRGLLKIEDYETAGVEPPAQLAEVL